MAVRWNTFGNLKGLAAMTTYSPAFDFERSASLKTREALICEVQTGLRGRPRSLSPWIFYDANGSRLFEQITQLPEYYLTRTERGILANFAETIISLVRGDQRQSVRLVELGAGTASKTRILLNAIGQMQTKTLYIPVDVSFEALDLARNSIASCLPHVVMQPIVGNYVIDPPRLESFGGTTLAIYLGSSIGNFSPKHARTILRNLRSQLQRGDALLLGTDMMKDEKTLVAAYDDRDGVTAAFNLNILCRLNRELDADFGLACYRHRALWNPEESRIEMHLESVQEQRVRVAAANLDLHFANGETIHTENSYKFTPMTVCGLFEDTGFGVEQSWSDEQGWYAVTLGRVR